MQETRETWVQFQIGKDALEEEMAPHASIPAWNSLGRGAWWATVHSVTKSQT